MWLSKMVSPDKSECRAERGKVTLSEDSNWEAGATVKARNIPFYSPYGYSFSAPVGEEIIIIPSSDGQVALGTKQNSSSLECGEICIRSMGGANIVLKNDGSVIINSLVINKDGVIENDR